MITDYLSSLPPVKPADHDVDGLPSSRLPRILCRTVTAGLIYKTALALFIHPQTQAWKSLPHIA